MKRISTARRQFTASLPIRKRPPWQPSTNLAQSTSTIRIRTQFSNSGATITLRSRTAPPSPRNTIPGHLARSQDSSGRHYTGRAMSCLFCKIIDGSIPSTRVYEDEQCIAFADINPQAPIHVLVVPRKHIVSLAEATEEDSALLSHLLSTVAEIAREKKLAAGYRVVINTGENGGQTVDHLHLHLLGGRAMHWPPG